jgi:hypothetical protein
VEFFFMTGNAPFAAALCLMVLIGAVEALGLGLGAVQPDWAADLNGNADVLGWLGIGQVPLLILIVLFLALFSLLGFGIQMLASAFWGSPLSAWIAAPAAAVASLPLLGASARAAARILPGDETTAVDRDSLLGKRATVTVGTARVGSPARAGVLDQHGQRHFVMVEPTDERTAVPSGQSLLLVRREGDIFIGLAEGEDLSLTLDDRPKLSAF